MVVVLKDDFDSSRRKSSSSLFSLLVVESDDGANDDDGVVVDAREHKFVAILSNVFFYLAGKTITRELCLFLFLLRDVSFWRSHDDERGRKGATKRKRDSFVSSLWELIVKCDDVSFQHILPRLNRLILNSCTE